MKINDQLQDSYTEQYENPDITEWRLLGGRGKAKNIIDIYAGKKPTSMIDVGSGEGSVLHWLDQFGFCDEITGLEISESGIAGIERRQLASVKAVRKFDGYTIPFPDQHFELATCSHVMEHVEFPRTLIREIIRVSQYQIFEVPIDFSYKVDRQVKHFMSYGHINIYTPQTFRFLLKSEGLEVVRYQNRLYEKAVYDHMNKKMPFFKTLKKNIINAILRNTPKALEYKPEVTTVLTKATQQKGLSIMEK